MIKQTKHTNPSRYYQWLAGLIDAVTVAFVSQQGYASLENHSCNR
jgi:hypothetical protein